MAIHPDDERRLRRNWTFLKQELNIEEFVHVFVERGIFAPNLRNDILNVIPNTTSMKGEKFLNAVISSGNRGYQAFCNLLRENADNRYRRVLEMLDIPDNNTNAEGMPSDSRPSTAMSSASSGTVNSETGERNRRVRIFSTDENANTAPVATVAPVVAIVPERNNYMINNTESNERRLNTDEGAVNATVNQQQNNNPSIQNDGSPSGASSLTATSQDASGSSSGISVDMQALENELVRIAPTIADLFQKITKQTRNLPTSEDEIQRVKDENERLRKTNKSLIEKLNTFQQKIIQLQLDNKRLKENSDVGRVKKDEIQQKAVELQEMERRLDEHKRALEEKEQELNIQLQKLAEIEEENELQKEKINKLEELQDEGILERNIQQEQISTLVEEKEKQRDQIDTLEEHQRMGEQRLFRLEERLKMLEQPRRQGRGRRVVSPPRNSSNNYWMNGIAERSHHANVKFQPDLKFNPDNDKRSSTKKGWPFI